MGRKSTSASSTQMDLVLLLLKSLKGDLISLLNQTVLLSSLAEKTTLLKHELLKRIKKRLNEFSGVLYFLTNN